MAYIARVIAAYDELTKDDCLKLRLRKAIGPVDIHKFLADLISKQPILTIIIEKDTQELREALNTLRYPQIKVVEFQTFVREGVGLPVHAHLFETVLQAPVGNGGEGERPGGGDGKKRPRIAVSVKDLIDANILKVGQEIYRWYRDNKYAAIILHNGKIKLIRDNSEHNSLSTAAKGIAGSVDGWEWWRTTRANGEECLLDELRKEYNSSLSP